MATTVKLSNSVKERLDKIKAQLLLQGIKLKQEDLLEKIITLAESHPLLFQNQLFEGVDKRTKNKIMSVSFDLGSSSEDTIDDDLYNQDE